MRPALLLSSLLFVPTAGAQTFVVDANNGPGTAFTSLATAAATVPDGAVLQVRTGDYPDSVTIAGKGLTVLCDPDVRLVSQLRPVSLTIQGTAANQRVTVRGLRMHAVQAGAAVSLVCANNFGLVCVDDVSPSLSTFGSTHLTVTGCSGVWLRECTFMGRTTLTNSEVVLVACTIPTPPSVAPIALARQVNGIDQDGGAVQLVDCSVHGPTGGFFVGKPGIVMNSGSLRVLGSTTLASGPAAGGAANGFAIAGSGAARLDPAVLLVGGASPIEPSVAATTVAMPDVTVEEVPPAGTVQADVRGPIGQAAFLLVSLTGPAFSVPSLVADSIWLDPFSMLVLVGGVPAAGAPVSHQLFMPAVSTTLGFAIVWQSLSLDAVAGLQIGNPDYFVVH